MSTSNLSCIEWTATTRDTHRVLRPSDLPKEFRARNPNALPWIITIVSEVSRPRFCLFTSATCQIPVRVAPKCGSENLFDMPARSTFKIGAARLRYVLFQRSHQARINTRFPFLRKSVRVFIWQQIYNIFLFKKKNYSIRNLENGLDNSFFFFFFQFLSIRHAKRFFSRICKASSEEKWTGQYPVWITQEPRKGDFRELKSKTFPGVACPDFPSIYPRSAPAPYTNRSAIRYGFRAGAVDIRYSVKLA